MSAATVPMSAGAGNGWQVSLRWAWRELRAGPRGLRIVLACLALGVAAIAAVGSLRAAIESGLAADGRAILGGDLELQGGSQPIPDAMRDWLRSQGARYSDVLQTRSMLVADNGERQLVELKAVDEAWPLVGAAVFAPPQSTEAALSEHDQKYGFAAEQLVVDRLGLKVGDQVRLGQARVVLRGVLTTEPDRVASPAVLGPRVLISRVALPATNLIQPGSIVEHNLRIVAPPGRDVAAFRRELTQKFPDRDWRVRDAHDAVPGLVRFIDQTTLFLTLVGLTSLLVGGIGVANGTRAWLEARARSIATLRCLGAPGSVVFRLCLLQVMALAALGIVLGLIVGAALPPIGLHLFSNLLPVPAELGVFWRPLLLAGAYGLLTAATFSLAPLGRALRIPGAALFRDALTPSRVRPPVALLAVNAVVAVLLVALTVFAAPDRWFAAWFCAAALATLLVFRLGGAGLVALATRAPRLASPAVRLGLANLHRPGSATPLMLVSLGIGLSTLACVALIEGNIRHQILDQLPSAAPSFFFIDIQDDELGKFKEVLAAQPGVQAMQEAPNLRARIVSVNGVPAAEVHATPDTQWALRGDRGLTYAATPPPGSRVVAGSWWPADYDGPPLVSFDVGLAKGWGIGVGATITVNVLGRDIDLKVANLRDVAWRTLALNYAIVASPGLLAHAPHSHIATVRVAAADQAGVLRAVTDALPNVTGIRVEDVLHSIATFLSQLGTALAAVGTLTLASGGLVLAGAVAAGQRRRTQEAVILKSVGATRAQIRAAWLVEFGVLGAVAGLLAALIGSVASFAVVHWVMHQDWALLPGTLAATLLGCILLMLGFGYAGTAAALRAKAAPLLRND